MLQTRVMSCGVCKNHVHESCFAEWRKQKKSSNQEVTCVYCRCAPFLCTLALTLPAQQACI